MTDDLLRIHGDTQVAPGEVDFAVNVHGDRPPEWLAARLQARILDLAAYPTAADDLRARRAAARRHGTDAARVLPLAGSAEGFHLLAEHAARRGLRAAVVHPSFTEPEVELRRAGVPVTRVELPEPYTFDPALVPEAADLVVVGNPTNPTSVLHPREALASLCRPGRVTVVDEAFCDVVDDEEGVSLAGADLPGLVVLRSVTKTWALAGLRAGYAVGDPAVLADLAAHRVHWPLGTLQLEAVAACCSDEAAGHLARIRDRLATDRVEMCGLLEGAGIAIAVPPAAPFVLVKTPVGIDPGGFRGRLRSYGYATRRCDTFPGLDPAHVRLAVRDPETVRGLVAAWQRVVGEAHERPSR
ncbi:Rv2231c family pyridoxal phosphate-dependent protein CobC [Rhodococcus sp. IEGM 1408]|uniref:Rv2231c family pyridoxal phosphate-dependent protein CobC n=1 Tax=Rhodococcus sp. IEGM 1408 TaxID=3082220 RepID=UPI002952EB4C|nr:Rv2231c family pyridoxal phosphate-dependent protein CobC [Rhodococcus sp. IEGM 1408]MDV8001942.1 Rv2231c family pyridoxal phosphate-dependent protein CobC [Rhodococcus sp. IEGM 1408]